VQLEDMTDKACHYAASTDDVRSFLKAQQSIATFEKPTEYFFYIQKIV